MLIKSQLFSSAQGSLGEVTAVRTSGGLALKERTNPSQPLTAAQVNIRAFFAGAIATWNFSLTKTEREEWNSYARNQIVRGRDGRPSYITGREYFVKHQVPRRQFSLGTPFNPPAQFSHTVLTQAGIIDHALFFRVSITFDETDEWRNRSDAWLVCWASKPVSIAVKSYRGQYRPLGSIAGSSRFPPVSGANLFILPFPIGSDAYYFFRFQAIRDNKGHSMVRNVGPVLVAL